MFLIIFFLFLLTHPMHANVVFLDSEEYPEIVYKSFFERFVVPVKYFSVSAVLSAHPSECKDVDFVILNLTSEIIKNSSKDPAKKFWAVVKNLLQSRSFNSTSAPLLLFMPPIYTSKIRFIIKALTPIMKELSIRQITQEKIINLEKFLLQSLQKTYGYPTTLLPQKEVASNSKNLAMFFPLESTLFGRIIVARKEFLQWNSLLENCHLEPILSTDKLIIKKKLDSAWLQQFGSYSFIRKKEKKQNELDSENKKLRTNENSNLNIWGWGEFPMLPIDGKNKSEHLLYKKTLDSFVNSFVDSKLDGIWLTPAINEYWSCIAKYSQNVELFKTSILNFLKKVSSKKSVSTKIFFSIEIVNNLIDQNLPRNQLHNLWGDVYVDQPNPLDESFWKQEVIDPCKKHWNFLKNLEMKNDFGLVIDLEMYLRKSGSMFNSISGFNKENIEKFFDEFILTDQDVFLHLPKYFNFLQRKAYLLGAWVARELCEILQNKNLAIYSPVLIPNWFYLGFLAGFSSVIGKTLYFSFQDNFYQWNSWLIDNEINLSDFKVFMLSKLNNKDWKKNFKLCGNRVWINRFSRATQAYSNDSWFEIESARDSRTKKQFLKYLSNLRKNL